MSRPVIVADHPLAAGASDTDALSAKLDVFISMIQSKDRGLMDEVWSESGFRLVGSERGEVCATREQVEAKLGAILASPKNLVLEFPLRRVTIVGTVGWIFAEGVLKRRDASGQDDSRTYLAMCIFEKIGGAWRWREFFGSEPY